VTDCSMSFNTRNTRPRVKGFALFVNTGHGFVRTPGAITGVDPIDDNYAFYRAQVLDWNGDGRQDLLVPEGRATDAPTWILHISTDQGGPFQRSCCALMLPTQTLDSFAVPVLLDHDGDGDQDLIVAGGDFKDATLSIAEGGLRTSHLAESITGRAPTPARDLLCHRLARRLRSYSWLRRGLRTMPHDAVPPPREPARQIDDGST